VATAIKALVPHPTLQVRLPGAAVTGTSPSINILNQMARQYFDMDGHGFLDGPKSAIRSDAITCMPACLHDLYAISLSITQGKLKASHARIKACRSYGHAGIKNKSRPASSEYARKT
jgi:hypothetical protein